ncbi:hypothetical protein D5H75_26415 [Bailinhaonella thermotolerans]|uniref:Uncharacterized protein n=2 Tax=Bailinhaonella thermotolerans TaxID=1070861 RepID=A0A3A4AE02_9ACTN|nr:hypothetical protein D5H75_26415 [Bailinhaonella thermotolerans]
MAVVGLVVLALTAVGLVSIPYGEAPAPGSAPAEMRASSGPATKPLGTPANLTGAREHLVAVGLLPHRAPRPMAAHRPPILAPAPATTSIRSPQRFSYRIPESRSPPRA